MRVVVCDDGKVFRDAWRAMLQNLGHHVVGEGVNGHDAVRLCSEQLPDLAMLDCSMGEMGGDLASVKIKEAKTAKAVLLVTSRGSVKDELEAKGIPVLVKPIREKNLAKKIAEIFGA